jgi:hypothetical protein
MAKKQLKRRKPKVAPKGDKDIEWLHVDLYEEDIEAETESAAMFTLADGRSFWFPAKMIDQVNEEKVRLNFFEKFEFKLFRTVENETDESEDRFKRVDEVTLSAKDFIKLVEELEEVE